MPTPSNGSISFTDIENEFKRVDGAPSSVSEYCGRPGSSAGVPYGILGVPTAGLVSFSNLPLLLVVIRFSDLALVVACS